MTTCRLIPAIVISLLLPLSVQAQEPTQDVQDRFSANWVIDSVASDPLPSQSGPEQSRPDPGAAVGGAPVSGGGGGGRRRGGGGAGGGAGATGARPAGLGARGGGGRISTHVRALMVQLRAPATMIITATASDLNIADTDGSIQSWIPDGRVRQKATLDGEVLESMAEWKGDRIEIVAGVANQAELKRRFKLSKDGQVLEVKIEIKGPSMPRKLSRTVKYNRQ